MKIIASLSIAAWLLAGCVTAVPHDDSPGATNRDAGPGLCTDGTAPPCSPPRD